MKYLGLELDLLIDICFISMVGKTLYGFGILGIIGSLIITLIVEYLIKIIYTKYNKVGFKGRDLVERDQGLKLIKISIGLKIVMVLIICLLMMTNIFVFLFGMFTLRIVYEIFDRKVCFGLGKEWGNSYSLGYKVWFVKDMFIYKGKEYNILEMKEISLDDMKYIEIRLDVMYGVTGELLIPSFRVATKWSTELREGIWIEKNVAKRVLNYIS